MGPEENKRLIEQVIAGEGDYEDQWAEDAVWIIPGTTRWSVIYRGKQEILEKLLVPFAAELESRGAVKIKTIIAEGDYVVVEAQAEGRVTKTGKQYNNAYCLVYKIIDGKIEQLTEYCDTELITEAFGK
jgi:ketosteroid isomerase-like protein